MKKIILLTFLCSYLFGFSQTQADLGKIQLSILFSEDQYNNYDSDLLDKVDSKLTQLLSENGIVSTAYNNGLVLQPKIILNNNEVVEGGMQNINVTNITLQLLMKQDQTNMVFASYSKQLKGTGRDQYAALNNAINSLDSNDPAIQKFISQGTEKLMAYYQSNCSQIMTKSANLEKNGRYEESLALLQSIPEKTSCYKTAQTKSIETYRNFQKKNCAAFIKQAKVYIAERNYEEAFPILASIESTSSCSAESNALIKSMDSKITAEERKQWNMQLKMYNDDVALEKLRIRAIKDIAVSYYQSQKRPNSTIIIK